MDWLVIYAYLLAAFLIDKRIHHVECREGDLDIQLQPPPPHVDTFRRRKEANSDEGGQESAGDLLDRMIVGMKHGCCLRKNGMGESTEYYSQLKALSWLTRKLIDLGPSSTFSIQSANFVSRIFAKYLLHTRKIINDWLN